MGRYGDYSPDGRSYLIARPDTPRPWVNYISVSEAYGMQVSNLGGGYSAAGLPNRCILNLAGGPDDEPGKYIYLRDEATGEFWSLTWRPCMAGYDVCSCRHGPGETEFNVNAVWDAVEQREGEMTEPEALLRVLKDMVDTAKIE